MISISSVDDDIAKERGRLLAAHSIANSPEKRKQMEEIVGKDYCMRRWPEAYNATVFGDPLDQLKDFAFLRRQ